MKNVFKLCMALLVFLGIFFIAGFGYRKNDLNDEDAKKILDVIAEKHKASVAEIYGVYQEKNEATAFAVFDMPGLTDSLCTATFYHLTNGKWFASDYKLTEIPLDSKVEYIENFIVFPNILKK